MVLEKILDLLEKSLGQQGDKIQSIIKEINPEYSLEGLIAAMKLKDACSLEGKL